MCGITGGISPATSDTAKIRRNALAMTDALAHRGPDDSGTWLDDTTGAFLGHRRLAIQDLSPLGHQPMHSASGRYTTVFNGEIYNFLSLRKELNELGYPFRSNSDTEVLLAAIEQWGIDKSVSQFTGMFAFAVWDHKKKRLHLVRDRLGIKPLYYGWTGDGTFLFSSELKAFRIWPDFSKDIDLNSLSIFFRHGYIPAPHTIYRDARKVPPGNIITLDETDCTSTNIRFKKYWSIENVYSQGVCHPFSGTAQEATDTLHDALLEAVHTRLISDRPIGAFLSGGIDSSTIVALMQSISNKPVETFTIGFAESEFDESIHAASIAKYLGTSHTSLQISSKDLLETIPDIPTIWDEPFGDSSQIPTLLLSRLAGKHITVALSGDGGDELFYGYQRYLATLKLWKQAERCPYFLRKIFSKSIQCLPHYCQNAFGTPFRPLLQHFGAYGEPGQVLHRMSELLAPESFQEFYGWANSHQLPRDGLIPDKDAIAERYARKFGSKQSHISTMSLLDILIYLPDDILTKVDKASMSVGLEVRVPILDHRVVEFCATCPDTLKTQKGTNKWILRQILDRYVPPELIDRPKMGFGIPLNSWLRGPLREWGENLLDKNRLKQEGFLIPKNIRELWNDHLVEKKDNQYVLWNILMFQAWLDRWR